MALFLPVYAERNQILLSDPKLGPKVAHYADLSGYNLDASFSLELLMECDPAVPVASTARAALQTRIEGLRKEIHAALFEFDYNEVFNAFLSLVDLQLESFRLEIREEHGKPQSMLQSQLVPEAKFEVLPPMLVTCPQCERESKLLGELGHVRVTCPHCEHLFILKV